MVTVAIGGVAVLDVARVDPQLQAIALPVILGIDLVAALAFDGEGEGQPPVIPAHVEFGKGGLAFDLYQIAQTVRFLPLASACGQPSGVGPVATRKGETEEGPPWYVDVYLGSAAICHLLFVSLSLFHVCRGAASRWAQSPVR